MLVPSCTGLRAMLWYCLGRRGFRYLLASGLTLGRRSLNLGIGNILGLGAGNLRVKLRLRVRLFAGSLHFHRRQFSAVTEQLMHEGALICNRGALFDDKQGHQPIRDREQYREQRQKRVFLRGRCCRRNYGATNQDGQLALVCLPQKAAQSEECSFGTIVGKL